MKSWIIAMVAGLWLGGSAAMADAQAAFKVASKALATAETEQQVEDAFAKGALGIVGDPKVRQYRDLLESARDAAWKRVALPEGIRVTHVGVKPGKTADGTILPVRTFGFEVTGLYPVKEVWGSLVWMDTKGNILLRRDDVCFFSSNSDADAIPQGKSVIRERDFLPASQTDVATTGAQAVVIITKVLHVQK
jgi:hypothetical protein